MLIVSSNSTFVKSETTSNDTIVQPFGNFCFLIFVVNFLVFFTVCRDSFKGFNTLQGGTLQSQCLMLLV